jgi:hypothetical protein
MHVPALHDWLMEHEVQTSPNLPHAALELPASHRPVEPQHPVGHVVEEHGGGPQLDKPSAKPRPATTSIDSREEDLFTVAWSRIIGAFSLGETAHTCSPRRSGYLHTAFEAQAAELASFEVSYWPFTQT